MLVDTHCHLDGDEFQSDRPEVIERALAAGVEHMVAIGTGDGPPDLEAGLRMTELHPAIYATVGVHPHSAGKADEEVFGRLANLAAHERVVAIGEIGLDYHYNFFPPEVQRTVFERQLALAAERGLPAVIHTRKAWADTVDVIRASAVRSGIFHCFSEGPKEAEAALELGFLVSLAGIVTFPKATALHEVAKMVPLDRLLVETDAPYLAPVPYRGKRNEPAMVVHTAKRVAELRGLSLDEVGAATTANWRRLCLRVKRING